MLTDTAKAHCSVQLGSIVQELLMTDASPKREYAASTLTKVNYLYCPS